MNEYLETGSEIRRRSLQDTLSLFKDGERKYYTDTIFRQTIDYLCLGGSPEKIIENLIGIINSQQEEIKNLSQ